MLGAAGRRTGQTMHLRSVAGMVMVAAPRRADVLRVQPTEGVQAALARVRAVDTVLSVRAID